MTSFYQCHPTCATFSHHACCLRHHVTTLATHAANTTFLLIAYVLPPTLLTRITPTVTTALTCSHRACYHTCAPCTRYHALAAEGSSGYLDVRPDEVEARRAEEAAVNAAYDSGGAGRDALYDSATPEQGQQFAQFLNTNLKSQPLYGVLSLRPYHHRHRHRHRTSARVQAHTHTHTHNHCPHLHKHKHHHHHHHLLRHQLSPTTNHQPPTTTDTLARPSTPRRRGWRRRSAVRLGCRAWVGLPRRQARRGPLRRPRRCLCRGLVSL
jgi:hypothetical protein